MKKNKIILSLVALSLTVTSSFGFDLEDRLNKMESKIEAMENVRAEYNATKESYLDDMDELDATVAKLETSTMLNSKVRWGVNFATEDNFFTTTLADGTSFTDENVLRTKVEFNAFSQITKNMTFDATLSVYKNWADSTRTMYGFETMDSMQGRRPGDSGVYLTRGYVDWRMPEMIDGIPLTLTLGRQPSQGGISYEYSNNTQRKGTYTALAFDGNADGAILTAGLSEVTGIPGTSMRFAYGKAYQDDSMVDYLGTEEMYKDTNIGGVFIDAKIPGMDKSLLQASYVVAKDLMFGASDMAGNPVADNLGDVSIMTGVVSIPNIRGSKLDVFAHYSVSKSTSNGNALCMMEVAPGVCGYSMSLMGTQNMAIDPTMTVDKTAQKGTAYWIGGRYNMDNGWKVGAEYNKGDENWFSFTSGSENLYNKLAIRGTAMEVYAIVPISRYANFKVGMLEMEYMNSGSGMPIGAPELITATSVDNFGNSAVKTVRNIYGSFNVRF